MRVRKAKRAGGPQAQPIPFRAHQINVRMDDAEASRLAALAEHYDLDRSQVIRMLVKREWDATGQNATIRR